MINVVLFEEDGGWICHGLNIDYCAAGATEAEARLNFWLGLAQTFYVNQERLGTVERVMRKPPPEVLAELDELAKRPAQRRSGNV